MRPRCASWFGMTQPACLIRRRDLSPQRSLCMNANLLPRTDSLGIRVQVDTDVKGMFTAAQVANNKQPRRLGLL